MNDCAQDMHIDLMHALYVYSRMMGGGGGGLTKCCDNRGACRYVYLWSVGVYIYIYIYIRMKLGGSGGMPPPGKIRVFR